MKCSEEAAETNIIQACVRVGFTLCKTSLDFRHSTCCLFLLEFLGFIVGISQLHLLGTNIGNLSGSGGGTLLCIVGDVVYSQLTLKKHRRL